MLATMRTGTMLGTGRLLAATRMQLSTATIAQTATAPHSRLAHWLGKSRALWSLGKPKLTALVLCTTAAGYGMGHSIFDGPSALVTLAGTGLAAFSAHGLNQVLEAPFDAQMRRTSTRPLPTYALLTPPAFAWSVGWGVAGVGILYVGAGAMSAALAATTIGLYAFVYTPLKRLSWTNTVVGAVVGALPPAIGQCAGGPMELSSACHGCFLPALLFAWQFPHFCALSWNLREDYARAGYRMMAVERPGLNGALAVAFSAALPLASALLGPAFVVATAAPNAALIWLSWRFARDPSRTSSKRLFLYSLLHLPIVLAMALFYQRRSKAPRASGDEE